MARGKSGGKVGAFFGGTFFGILLCLALIAGLGCFVYFKVSPAWINKTFKTNIDLGTEELNKKTVKGFVSSAIDLANNTNSYTLEDLNKNFGVKINDNLFGINIADLKTVPFTELSGAIETKFANISAHELRNVSGMNLEEKMGNILDKENTYYFNSADNKLYKNLTGITYSQPVTFEYVVSEDQTTITTKGNVEFISDGKVKIPLWYLPITNAISDFTSNLGEQTTLYDLEHSYGVVLPKFLNSVDKQNTTVNELESVIKTIKIGEILELNIKYDSASDEYYNDIDKDNVYDAGEEIAHILKAISDTKVEDLDTFINDLKFSQIFSAKERGEGVLSLITSDPTIEEIPSAIESVISDTSIDSLIEKEIITVGSDDMSKLLVEVDHDFNSSTEKIALKDLTIDQFIDYCLDLVPNI